MRLLRNRARSRLSVEVQCSPADKRTKASAALHQRAEADGPECLLLKEGIVTIYEKYWTKKTLDPELARPLEILQTNIRKAKRNWR